MLAAWRWFGKADPISLKEIRQAQITDIVTALYHIPCGELWPIEDIQKYVQEVEAAGMRWSVVESVPIHESIKTRSGNFQHYIDIYKQNIKNLASCGVKTICYNFMPILDWTRTQLDYPMPDGSTVLNCDGDAVTAFDLFILKRPNAEKDYSEEEVLRAKTLFEKMNDAEKEKLSHSILLGLPGTVDDLTPEQFLDLLKTYSNVDDKALRQNLYAFLNEIAPLCDELDVKMAIHPDDPPKSIFGLPRIMSNFNDVKMMVENVPSEHMGLTFCSGSFGGGFRNDEVQIFRAFAPRIHFVHFRNVAYTTENTFHESSHLYGKVDMPMLMKSLLEEEARRGFEIPTRPDHGKLMEIDKFRTCYNGYSYGGRLMGISELRGLELGLKSDLSCAGKVAVVTGGAGVLCSVMTEDLLRHGATVVILDLREDVAQKFAAELAEKGLTRTLALAANVLERESLEKARQIVLDKYGKIDILINGAGGNHPRGTCANEQTTPDSDLSQGFFGLGIEGFEFVNKLNFIGTLLPSQVFGEAMIENGGNIINISSMSATQPLTKVGAYSASKAAIDNFTKWLATHLAPMNIRVNAIAPGFFITNQNRFLLLEQDEKTLTARGNKVIGKTPMRKFGKPSDLCGAIRYLISDDASFVTGIVIPIDGGFLAYSGV